MGLFGFGKKEWDEEKSDSNKARMKELFSRTVENSESYTVVYGFGLNVKNSNYIVARKVTYQYTSLIIGYRESDMSVVLLQTTPELEGCSEPEVFKRDEIKKAKVTMGQYTIYHQGGLMAGYTQFSVIEDNNEDYLVYCHQKEETDKFQQFWKKYCAKK
ncbi:MAG: hypothetical protein CR988_02255 [Treponema sp.]|nr:MAG: hypothetical protein CR988_02255 [Treponema sp.]